MEKGGMGGVERRTRESVRGDLAPVAEEEV